MPAPVPSPMPPRTSPSNTPLKPRIRLPRNQKYTFTLPPSTVIVPQFPTFKATFAHWSALLERRDLDASERTEEMTDYSYFPELEGREDNYSVNEEHAMRWNARAMREGAFERYRRVTAKFTPKKRIWEWVERTSEVKEWDNAVSPVKARIRMSPAIRKALDEARSRQLALEAAKAQQQFKASLARAKTAQKLGENSKPRRKSTSRSPDAKRGRVKVVDFGGPGTRTRSSERKKALAAAAGPAEKIVPVTGALKEVKRQHPAPRQTKRKLAELPAAVNGAEEEPRPAKKQRTKATVRKATVRTTLEIPLVERSRESVERADVERVESMLTLPTVPTQPAITARAPATGYIPTVLITPADAPAPLEKEMSADELVGEVLRGRRSARAAAAAAQAPVVEKRTTRRAAAAGTSASAEASTLLERAKREGPRLRTRPTPVPTKVAPAPPARKTNTKQTTRLSAAAAVVVDDRTCPGCEHVFASAQGLKRHRVGVRAREGCRA